MAEWLNGAIVVRKMAEMRRRTNTPQMKKPRFLPGLAKNRCIVREHQIGPEGLEPPTNEL